jgi:FixJ family two-component response regulator
MSKNTVILIDADPAVRSSIAFAMGVEGYEVASYASAGDILAISDPLEGLCLLIDHRLPDADALSLLARLRARGAAMPAIVVTSNPTRRFRQRVKDARALLLEKPLLGDALIAMVRRAAGISNGPLAA